MRPLKSPSQSEAARYQVSALPPNCRRFAAQRASPVPPVNGRKSPNSPFKPFSRADLCRDTSQGVKVARRGHSGQLRAIRGLASTPRLAEMAEKG